MRKIISLFLIGFFGFTAFAQEPIVKWGESIDSPSDPSAKILQIMQLDPASGFFAHRKVTNGMSQEINTLEKYDDSNKLVFSKEFPSAEGVMGDGILFRKILPLKDKFLTFYTGFKNSTKESYFLVRSLAADGTQDKAETKLESITVLKAFNSGDFEVKVSPDKSKLLVMTTFPYAKEQKAKIRLKVFDVTSMKELGSKDIERPYDSKKWTGFDFIIDNAGNAYVIERFVNEAKDYAFGLLTFNLKSGEFKENLLNIGTKTISEQHRFKFNPAGNVVFVSFLFNKTEYTHSDIYCLRVNASTQVIENQSMTGLGDPALKEQDNEEFSYFKLRGVEFMSNGDFVVIAEHEDVTTNYPAQAGTNVKPTYTYSTNQIRVASIKPDGTRAWIKTINRNTEKCTVPDEYSRWDSFVYGMVNDRLHIIYSNTDLFKIVIGSGLVSAWKEADGTVYRFKQFAMNTNNPMFMYVVEPNGELTFGDRKYGLPLFNFQAGNAFSMNLNAALFYQLPDGILMHEEMPDGKKYQFGKILF